MRSSPSNQMDFYFDIASCFPMPLIVCLQHIQYIGSLTILDINFTFELIPIKSDGRDYVMNFFSIVTASVMIYWILSDVSLFSIIEYRWQAKSVWSPSSLEISSFENVSPGISDLFLSQNIAQNEPEKKIPSTAANATNLYWKVLVLFIHFMAQPAFSLMTSTFEIALKR